MSMVSMVEEGQYGLVIGRELLLVDFGMRLGSINLLLLLDVETP